MLMIKSSVSDWLTVWAVADSGVLWTGVFLLLLLSHRTIWPEYVPPTIKLGWNLANVTDVTPDWKDKDLKQVRKQVHNTTFMF